MFEFFKNLQNKPEPIKRSIMWISIFFIMIIIFTFWIFTFPSQTPAAATEDGATQNLKNNLPSAFESFKSQFQELLNLFK